MESIEIKNMDIQGLNELVNKYPWFAAARKALCLRTSQLAGKDSAKAGFEEAALYFGSRRILAEEFYSEEKGIARDKDVEALVKAYLEDKQREKAMQTSLEQTAAPRVIVLGGDYFSPIEYEQVRSSEAFNYGSIASNAYDNAEQSGKSAAEGADLGNDDDSFESICTETLAQIYAEQGYREQAKVIYSKLILRYPEKNAYFAALIEKMDKEINN